MTRKYTKRSTMTREEALKVAEDAISAPAHQRYVVHVPPSPTIEEAAFAAAIPPKTPESLPLTDEVGALFARIGNTNERIDNVQDVIADIETRLATINARIGI